MFTTEQPDPSWLTAVRARRSVLWLGPEVTKQIEESESATLLRELILRPWAAVVVDASGLQIESVIEDAERVGELVLRHYLDNPGPERLPPNRLPIYVLRGPDGDVLPNSTPSPKAQLVRFQMLQRLPADQQVIAIGVSGEEGVSGIVEASSIASPFSRLVLVEPTTPTEDLDKAADSVFHWTAQISELADFLADVIIGDADSEAWLLVRTTKGLESVNVAEAIDASYPITASFALLPAAAALMTETGDSEQVGRFLRDPTEDWAFYSNGIPFPRVLEHEDDLLKLLRSFRDAGPSASSTAWLPAEEGSGGTTALRQLAMTAARSGYPVLVANPDVTRFDFTQISAFLTKASDRLGKAGVAVPEVPWVIAFDAEHTSIHRDFVAGLASGLGKLLRSTVVLAVRPEGRFADEARYRAHGVNRVLGVCLRNAVTSDEAVEVGEHLSSFLPPDLRRSAEEWKVFAADAVRTTPEGATSLFWVALRFWLGRLPGAGESLRAWLHGKLVNYREGREGLYVGFLDVAAMSRHRLVMPAELLDPAGLADLRDIAREPTNPFGLRRLALGGTDGFVVTHPLIAEELLRIAHAEARILREVGLEECLSLLDLELHLLAQILRRPAAGSEDSAPIIEELVTSGLKVDPRAAPRNYHVRDRIVSLLENAPDSLFDSSQVFNHHLAKARRHLAWEPPKSAEWTIDARLEQLDLAECHLLDCLQNIHPEDPERREAPLNLRVSLALTLDLRARLEAEEDPTAAEAFRARAEDNYAIAQRLDADNSYVLENFSRFKIRKALETADIEERLRLLVEAVSMLHWEQQVLEPGHREEPILVELARAYDMIEEESGRGVLRVMADHGSEPAAIALARLALREFDSERALAEAEEVLTSLPAPSITWHSRFVLYQLVARSRPTDFHTRLELLSELDSEREFPWPLQLLLEFGILLYQLGDFSNRKRGRVVFRRIRDQLAQRSATIRVPRELKFLADPSEDFKKRLLTSMTVKNTSNVGRNYYAVPHGWVNQDIPFRPYHFGEALRQGDERDCFVQFTNFGPQAVPSTVD